MFYVHLTYEYVKKMLNLGNEKNGPKAVSYFPIALTYKYVKISLRGVGAVRGPFTVSCYPIMLPCSPASPSPCLPADFPPLHRPRLPFPSRQAPYLAVHLPG